MQNNWKMNGCCVCGLERGLQPSLICFYRLEFDYHYSNRKPPTQLEVRLRSTENMSESG